jgi:hypothetical protein
VSDGAPGSNGHLPSGPGGDGASDADHEAPGDVEAALDALDAEPLDPDEAAAGAALAADAVDETLDGRVEAVVDALEDVERRRSGTTVEYLADGRPFAVLGEGGLETVLDPAVAKAALRTPDTAASARGAGWIRFAPRVVDRYALDRAEAWVRLAHRRTTGR